MIQKYKNKIAYLFKMEQLIKDGSFITTWEDEGTAFYCNKESKTRMIQTHMAGQYSSATDDIIKTVSQLNFVEGDRIAFTKFPKNDVNNADFSIIKSVKALPLRENGSKHRTQDYYEYWITIT